MRSTEFQPGVQTMTIRIIDALAEAVFGWLDTNVSNINLFSDDETVDNGSGEIPVVRVTGEIIANYDYNRWPGYSPGIDRLRSRCKKSLLKRCPQKPNTMSMKPLTRTVWLSAFILRTALTKK